MEFVFLIVSCLMLLGSLIIIMKTDTKKTKTA